MRRYALPGVGADTGGRTLVHARMCEFDGLVAITAGMGFYC
jgi:hypothetical protein